MKKINIEYLDEVFVVSLSKINAFPNGVYKMEFENNSKLLAVLQSPVYILEKPDVLSFPYVKNTEQIDLLRSFAQEIEENYSIILN